MSDETRQIDDIREAFGREFERFAHLELNGLDLPAAEGCLSALNELKIKHSGKKSPIAGAMKLIGKVAPEDRAQFGSYVQQAEAFITESLLEAESRITKYILDLKLERDSVDVTIPGRRIVAGRHHPITILRQRIEDIFVSMGYTIEDDREIETDHYNFDALNIPQGHPARESQDTFYTTEGFALRSQTSTVQIRAMERRGVPIRILAPGKVFRRDTPDMTHTPMFHQLEGLCVEKGITMAHLKGTVTEWLKRLFGAGTITRFRPSYFPFTEPSAEFDFSCFKCQGTGNVDGDRCRPCKGSGWIELGGCGMVHPNVLRACGVDPEEYTGFAFGFGLERMTAMLYNIDDIRHLFENDMRFLEQFR
ncbi:MAG: phenylalanine--tRNA ligase subunit alpha [Chloracidobacterium sp.]|nr:phenylalanine--tRNA ligase subunit alpha [Chloracidobacterium sp.]MCO5334531.1 phenylalanine--tRNA ligase subunit alpha [Pyrinomonadaceae bacterium]